MYTSCIHRLGHLARLETTTSRNTKGKLVMRMFWTLFFIGSMLLVGYDVAERRLSPVRTAPVADGDAMGAPTPQ